MINVIFSFAMLMNSCGVRRNSEVTAQVYLESISTATIGSIFLCHANIFIVWTYQTFLTQ